MIYDGVFHTTFASSVDPSVVSGQLCAAFLERDDHVLVSYVCQVYSVSSLRERALESYHVHFLSTSCWISSSTRFLTVSLLLPSCLCGRTSERAECETDGMRFHVQLINHSWWWWSLSLSLLSLLWYLLFTFYHLLSLYMQLCNCLT